MAKVYYDPEQMKKGAEAIEKELKNFHTAREQIERTIEHLSQNWSDTTHDRLAGRFQKEAKEAMENAADQMQRYADLLKQAAKRYSNVIDSGNGKLSS